MSILCRSLCALFLCLMLTSCSSIVSALFGDSVEVNSSDSSPPSVRISVADVYVRDPDPGDFVVSTVDRSAQVSGYVMVSAFGEDSQGVRFVEILDITIEPTCAPTPVGRDGRPPAPPTFLRAPVTVISGQRAETPASSSVATTRVPVFKSINLRGGSVEASRWCPEDRPLLGNAIARIRARAANFGGGVSDTAIASLSLQRISSAGAGVGFPSVGSSGGSGSSCADVGTACMTQPAECFGRGDGWQVPGTIQCRGDESVCVAESSDDFCSTCGGECGGCAGDSCSATNPCAPGSICARLPRLGGSIQRCQSIIIAETSTGNRPCTPLNGFCWLPDEAGQAEIICSESRE